MSGEECGLLAAARSVAEPGTTVEEHGRRAVVDRADPEHVIVVRLDSAAGRALLGLSHERAICDGLFLLLDETPWRLVFVELRGVHVARAVEQLESAGRAARGRFARECPRPPEVIWDAVVVCRQATPMSDWQRLVRRSQFRRLVQRVRERLDVRALT